MNTRKWKEFIIEDVFELKNATAYHKSDVTKTDDVNGLLYVTRTSLNNGVEMYVKYDDNFDINPGNQIVFGAENANFFYQEDSFITGNKMYLLRHKKLNKYIGLFLVNALRNAIKSSGFGYSLGMTATRLSKRKLLLPVNNDNNPDWDYMEHLGRSIYYKQNKDILGYLVKKMDTLEEEVKNKILPENIEWGLWTIGRLFNIKRVSGRTFESYDKGCFPYITTSSQRNGVNGFVRAVEEDISFRNSLTISPIDGTVFYHSFDFVGRGGAGSSIITLTNKYLNKYTGLFIKTAIECSSRAKASYGVQLNGDRLKATKF